MIPADPAVAGDEKSRALEEVLKSRTLARSEQLQGFLRYICEMKLAGRGDEISEHSIALHDEQPKWRWPAVHGCG